MAGERSCGDIEEGNGPAVRGMLEGPEQAAVNSVNAAQQPRVDDGTDPFSGKPKPNGGIAGGSKAFSDDPADWVRGMLDNAMMVVFGGVGLALGGVATRLGTKAVGKLRGLVKSAKAKPKLRPKGRAKSRKKLKDKPKSKGCRNRCGCNCAAVKDPMKRKACRCKQKKDPQGKMRCRAGCSGRNAKMATCPVGMNCFVAGTLVDGVAIESVRLGDEVRTWLPGESGWLDAGEHWATVREREVRLRHEGGVQEVDLLRPEGWLAERGVEGPSRWVELDLAELGVTGRFEVLEVGEVRESAYLVRPGRRRVTAVFRHPRGRVVDVRIEGEPAPVGCTPRHPFWSADRDGWAEAGALRAGERVRTAEGLRAVLSVAERGVEPVFNIEVEGDHCYRVGKQGVLVHNASTPCDDNNINSPGQHMVLDSGTHVVRFSRRRGIHPNARFNYIAVRKAVANLQYVGSAR